MEENTFSLKCDGVDSGRQTQSQAENGMNAPGHVQDMHNSIPFPSESVDTDH